MAAGSIPTNMLLPVATRQTLDRVKKTYEQPFPVVVRRALDALIASDPALAHLRRSESARDNAEPEPSAA